MVLLKKKEVEALSGLLGGYKGCYDIFNTFAQEAADIQGDVDKRSQEHAKEVANCREAEHKRVWRANQVDGEVPADAGEVSVKLINCRVAMEKEVGRAKGVQKEVCKRLNSFKKSLGQEVSSKRARLAVQVEEGQDEEEGNDDGQGVQDEEDNLAEMVVP